jgi:Helicase associated domain/Helicase conserved C-terminal domain
MHSRQLALAHAVDTYNIKKAFTFHRTVLKAETFTSEGAAGIRQHLSTSFQTLHVNGEMNTGVREGKIREFRDADRAILSNAGCLTEGVNIPEVDLVAFMSPKSSRVDIVQAAGRAMRKTSDGSKTVGFVLIPLFVDQRASESLEEAVDRSNFGEVWRVLGALMDQDDDFADIIRVMREEKGRSGRFSDRRFSEKVEVLGPGIAIDDLRSAITTQCVNQFARSWDEHFVELKAFREKNGHFTVPRRSTLGYFVGDARKDRKAGKLSAKRAQRLDEIGFVWDLPEAAWEENIEQLKEFKRRYSHCNVSRKWPDKHLFGFVADLRTNYRRGKINPERLRLLAEIGFSFHRPTDAWDEMFRTLLAYKQLQGDCNVPVVWEPNQKLGSWVNTQRTEFRTHSLNTGRIRQLEEAGFIWHTPNMGEWERLYRELAAYRQTNGNCLVPTQTELGRWTNNQRKVFATDSLSTERRERLEQLGLDGSARPRFTALWEEGFAMLVQYREEFGNCDAAPRKHPLYGSLSGWMHNQRTRFRKRQLNPDQIRRLEAIGFKWKA